MQISNKEVSSITINNKEVQSIKRVSDNAIIYEKKKEIEGQFVMYKNNPYVIQLISDTPEHFLGEEVIIQYTIGQYDIKTIVTGDEFFFEAIMEESYEDGEFIDVYGFVLGNSYYDIFDKAYLKNYSEIVYEKP